jgi:4-hydroxybenzoate polyprenyltransferase
MAVLWFIITVIMIAVVVYRQVRAKLQENKAESIEVVVNKSN